MAWQVKVSEKRTWQYGAIPEAWRLDKSCLDGLSLKTGAQLIEEDVARHCGILSEVELRITNTTSATALVKQLGNHSVSALEVTTAFCKRAAVAQQLTSCLTEIFFEQAMDRAKFLDEHFLKTGKRLGPLHGLPVSIKDSFRVKGIQSTVGWVSFLEQPPASSNSALVDILLKLGAVLYCKTNIPQTMMTGDSENNIFGRTLNPHNTALTAGGSSGGEGALLAFRGSTLGVGTDIAGSIRIPALCCGVYGFKPSSHRVPFGGQLSGAMEGIPGIIPSAGPLAHSLDDIELFMQTVLGASPENYDCDAHAVPWRQLQMPVLNGGYEEDITPPQPRLTIGVLNEDPDYPLHPPVRRALNDTIIALKHAGHKIIQIPASTAQISLANRLAFQYFISGPDTDSTHFVGPDAEPPVASVAAGSSPLFTGPLPVDAHLDAFYKWEELAKSRKQLLESWRELWVRESLDAVVAPGAQCTAVPHDTFGWPPYTLVWNLLDFPACIIPCGKASKETDPADFTMNSPVQPSYHSADVDGAPLAIQIITRRFEDEKCIFAARIVETAILRAGRAEQSNHV